MSCPKLFEPVDAAHLQTCAECRAFQAAMSVPAPAVDLERLKGPALAALQTSPRAMPWWAGALALVAVTSLAAVAGMALLSPTTGQHVSPLMRHVSSAAWATLMIAACFLAVVPGARGLRSLLVASLAGCFALTLAAASGRAAGMGVGCALSETVVALLPIVAGLAVLTGFSFDATRALAAGIGASSAGMLAVYLHCPDGSLDHLVSFHLVPIAVLAALTLAARRVLPSRTHAP